MNNVLRKLGKVFDKDVVMVSRKDIDKLNDSNVRHSNRASDLFNEKQEISFELQKHSNKIDELKGDLKKTLVQKSKLDKALTEATSSDIGKYESKYKKGVVQIQQLLKTNASVDNNNKKLSKDLAALSEKVDEYGEDLISFEEYLERKTNSTKDAESRVAKPILKRFIKTFGGSKSE